MIQMKKMQYVVASLLAASVFTTAAEAANFNNEVKTQQGVVAGAYDDKHQVVQWLGVPYAQQPTGADRWREAQQAKKHKGILDCTKAAPANIQYNGKKVLGQEGMLTLDIVRPDTQEKNLPVLVYITAAIISQQQPSDGGQQAGAGRQHGLCFRTVSPGTFWL
mgnify:CR=1 FL=1